MVSLLNMEQLLQKSYIFLQVEGRWTFNATEEKLKKKRKQYFGGFLQEFDLGEKNQEFIQEDYFVEDCVQEDPPKTVVKHREDHFPGESSSWVVPGTFFPGMKSWLPWEDMHLRRIKEEKKWSINCLLGLPS